MHYCGKEMPLWYSLVHYFRQEGAFQVVQGKFVVLDPHPG
jgi:hypothetical protein